MVTVSFDRVSELIKFYRKDRGFSQEELAMRAGVRKAFVSHTERGLNKPSFENIQKLTKAMGIPHLFLTIVDEKDELLDAARWKQT